jgi:uncharacterized protein (TIRG00374 family)
VLVAKSTALTVLKYAVGLGLLGWVVLYYWEPSGDSPGLAHALHNGIRVAPLILALVICTASVLLTFVRWYVLVRAQDMPFSLKNAMRLGLIGYFVSTFLPGSVGGDVIKAAFLARQQSRRAVAVATVLLDRVIGLVGLVWLAALLGGLFWAAGAFEAITSHSAVVALETIIAVSWAIVGGSVLFWLLLGLIPSGWVTGLERQLSRVPKLGHSLAELWRAVWIYRSKGRSVGLALLMAIVGHVGFVVTFYCCACILIPSEEIPTLATHFLLTPVGMMVQAGCPTPNGMGGGEYIFGALYALVDSARANGVLASLAKRVIEWILALTGYLWYLWLKPGQAVEPEAPTAETPVLPYPVPAFTQPAARSAALSAVHPSL